MRRFLTPKRFLVALVLASAFALAPKPEPAVASSSLQCWRWIWQDPTHCSFCVFECAAGYQCCGPLL